MQDQSKPLPRLLPNRHQEHGRPLPHHQRMACAPGDLNAIGRFQAASAADRIEGLWAGMHMDRRGHAGREGRFQVLGAEIALPGFDRKRADVGKMASTFEIAPLRPQVEQPDLAKRLNDRAMLWLGALGGRQVGEGIDASVEWRLRQRAKILVGDKAGRTGRLSGLSRTGSRGRLGVGCRRRQHS